MSALTRRMNWRNALEKARWLDAKASLDVRLPGVRREAARYLHLGPTMRAIQLHRFVRDSIRYERDHQGRGVEDFSDSDEILKKGADDCDGKCRLLVALARATGLEARIVPVISPELGFTHVQAELRWPGAVRHPRANPDGWVRAECIVRGAELGMLPKDAPRDARGRLWLAGPGGRPITSEVSS